MGSAERLDLPDFLSIDSFVAADFKYLVQSFIGSDKPYILKGFDIIQPQDTIGTESVSIRVADSVVYYPTSGAGSFYYGLPEGSTGTDPLVPELRKNAVNFVYLSFTTFDTARDSRAFWDPDQNGGDGGEFSQDINTESVLSVEIGVSVSSFPEGTIPVCKISVGPSVIEYIQDARDLMFRLGTGGIAPDPFSTFPFREDPTSAYTRDEPSTIMASSLDANPFQGGDKNIFTLKEWMDVVMTRFKEITGDTYWYGTGDNVAVNDLWHDAVGNALFSKGRFFHDEDTGGLLSWSEDIVYHHLNDPREIRIRANEKLLFDNETVLYIEMIRDEEINSTSTPVDWLLGADYVNGQVGAFEHLAKGDFIKRKSDAHPSYNRVEEFYALPNLAGGTTTAPLAQSVRLLDNYDGSSGTELGTYTKGEYVLSDLNVTYNSDPAIHAIGGNMWWLAHRDDTITALESAVVTQLSVDILNANGTNAECYSVGHGLIDKDRVTITTGAFAGTYQIEVEDDDTFYITTTTVSPNELAQTAFYAIITSAERQTPYGYEVESAPHSALTDQVVYIENTSTALDGTYKVNRRNETQFQIAIDQFVPDPGPIYDEEIIRLINIVVRTQFGSVNVVQGQDIEVGNPNTLNILSYIGMDSLTQTKPVYTVPNDFSSQEGYENYNGEEDDDLTVRLAQVTAMMAMRVQDRGMYIQDRIDLAVDVVGTDLSLYTQNGSGTITVRKPGGNDQVFNLSATIPANSFVVAQIDRNNDASVANLSVLSIGYPQILDENNIILAWRMGTENKLRLWNGATIDAPGTLNWEKPEDSSNKNIVVFNPGRLRLDPVGGLAEILVQRSPEVTEVTFTDGSSVPAASYFTLNSANDATSYYVWYTVDAAGVDPAPGGTGIQVDILSTDTFLDVTSKTLAAVTAPLAADFTVTNPEVDQIKFECLLDGEATNATNVGTGFTVYVACEGSAPDIELLIPGSTDKNIIDVDAINTLGTHIIPDGYQAWVRVNRYAEKTFNTIATAVGDTIDGPTTGSIYITPITDTPIDQDIFVLWSRVGDSLIESHKGIHTDGNIYEEHLDVVAGVPANAYEIQGNIPAGTLIFLPPDSRDEGREQRYVVGSGQLQVWLEGQRLRKDKDYAEVGDEGCISSRIETLQELVVDDDLFFRIDSTGAVYFASDGALPSMQEVYETGRFITINTGQPLTIQGAGGKLLDIKGDINVDGVVDPTAVQFTLQSSTPLPGTDAGIWVNDSNELMFQRGTGATDNITTNYLRRDGTYEMLAALNMGAQQIQNLADNTAPQHATTQNFTETTYIRQDGTSLPSANINLNNFKLINVADPTDPQDGVTKNYADTTFLKLDGTNPMAAALNMGNFKLENLGTPTTATDGTTKGYVDTNFLKLDGTNPMAAALDMNTTHKIINLADPTAAQDAVTKNYADTTFAKLDGTNPMQANLDMGNYKIVNLGAPTLAGDATTKNYTDSTFLKLDGTNPMAAVLNMNNYKIENVATPVLVGDATNKAYVDLFLKRDGTNQMTANLNMGSELGTPATDAIHNITDSDSAFGTTTNVAQVFTATTNDQLNEVIFDLYNTGGAVGNIYVRLVQTAGGVPDPGPIVLASSDPIDASTLSAVATPAPVTFSFPTAPSLSAGTQYTVYLDASEVTADINVALDSGAGYGGGSAYTTANDGGVWIGAAYDTKFEVKTAFVFENRIINLTDPVNPQDAVTLNYGNNNYLRLDGTTVMTADLDIGGFRVKNGAPAVDDFDYTTKAYVDAPARRTGTFVFATNNSGNLILGGSVVALDGNGDIIDASAATESDAEGTIGVLLEDTADGVEGTIQITGKSIVTVRTQTDQVISDQLLSDVSLAAITAGDTNDIIAQSFTETDFELLNNVSFWLKGPNAPTVADFDVEVIICGDNGLDEPDLGSILATSDPRSVSTFNQVSWEKETFTFSTPFGVNSGTKYWLVLRKASGGTTGDVTIRVQSLSDPYAGGKYLTTTDGGTSWTGNAGDDAQFELDGEGPGALAAGEVFLSTQAGRVANDPPNGSGQVIFSLGVSSGPDRIIIRPIFSFINE
jgi:hypothetical protein